MKTTVLLVSSLLVIFATVQGQNTSNGTVSSDAAVDLGVDILLGFENATGGWLGCCPKIVRPGPTGSVIQPFTGWRGNAAIIVDWGFHHWRWQRPCTPYDHGFVYGVDWGDGSPWSIGRQKSLGPFQVTHQYAKYNGHYGVRAVYCSDPGYPYRKCCDSLYIPICTSYDPEHPYPPETFQSLN